MANYSGKEKASLNNIKELFQYLHGGGAQALRKALGLGDTLGALPVANGGTGATTVDGALENLGIEEYVSGLLDKYTTKASFSGLYTFVSSDPFDGRTQYNFKLSDIVGCADIAVNSNYVTINRAGTYNVDATFWRDENDEHYNAGATFWLYRSATGRSGLLQLGSGTVNLGSRYTFSKKLSVSTVPLTFYVGMAPTDTSDYVASGREHCQLAISLDV